MTRFFTLFCFLFAFTSLTAQQLYTVQVGTFVDVRNADFNEIKPLGFVYGNPLEGNLTQVFLGNYSDIAKAETVANQLKTRGFRNALVLQRPTQTGQNVVVIQLSTQTNGKIIEWEQMEQAGKLFVENDDQLIKIMTGIYPDLATAQRMLPSIQQLGYRDAFVKTVNNGRLIPVGTFETGIKKALIPISLNNNPPVTPMPNPAAQQGNNTNVIGANNGPATYNNAPTTSPGSSTAKSPMTANTASMPNIRGRIKRGSAQDLQTVLKEKGFYQGLLDGYYGTGTKQAYDAAWSQMPELAKYQLLSQLKSVPANDVAANWPATKVLITIADEMSGGMSDLDLAAQSGINRLGLYQTSGPLSAAATTRAKAWEQTLWGNLNRWATEDPLHAQIMSAFRLMYFQTKVNLEDFYMDKGNNSEMAKNKAVATLQALVGAELERFL